MFRAFKEWREQRENEQFRKYTAQRTARSVASMMFVMHPDAWEEVRKFFKPLQNIGEDRIEMRDDGLLSVELSTVQLADVLRDAAHEYEPVGSYKARGIVFDMKLKLERALVDPDKPWREAETIPTVLMIHEWPDQDPRAGL